MISRMLGTNASVPIKYGVNFSGLNSFLTIPGSTDFDFNSDFTIEFWVNPRVQKQAQAVCSITVSGTKEVELFLSSGTWSSGGTLLYMYTGSSWTHGIGTAAKLPLNTLSHVAITRSGSTSRLFYNGIAQVLNNIVWPNTPPTFSTGSLVIGRSSTSYNSAFNGIISNFRWVKGTALYTSDFIPSNILSVVPNTVLLTCNSSSIMDASSYNRTITPTNSPTIIQV
jgi:hypothetical protein